MLTRAKVASSRPRPSVRRSENVQYRLPSQAAIVEIATLATFAVSGLSPRSSPGP